MCTDRGPSLARPGVSRHGAGGGNKRKRPRGDRTWDNLGVIYHLLLPDPGEASLLFQLAHWQPTGQSHCSDNNNYYRTRAPSVTKAAAAASLRPLASPQWAGRATKSHRVGRDGPRVCFINHTESPTMHRASHASRGQAGLGGKG